MQLRRWCVSITGEPLHMFWTRRRAVADYWENWKFIDARERMGLYRWHRGKWVKQKYVINGQNGGLTKIWVDE